MKELIVGHLRSVWERYLAVEWERVRPMLMDSVQAFSRMDLAAMPRVEAFRFVTDREPPNARWETMITEARRFLLVPNAHVGPYLGKSHAGSLFTVMFGPRMPKGVHVDSPDLARREILTGLNVLADDARLRILHMAVQEEGIKTARVMEGLDLSQSAASRHLAQLTGAGYLIESRCETGKCYAPNPARIEDTLAMLSRYLAAPRRTARGTGPTQEKKERQP